MVQIDSARAKKSSNFRVGADLAIERIETFVVDCRGSRNDNLRAGYNLSHKTPACYAGSYVEIVPATIVVHPVSNLTKVNFHLTTVQVWRSFGGVDQTTDFVLTHLFRFESKNKE